MRTPFPGVELGVTRIVAIVGARPQFIHANGRPR